MPETKPLRHRLRDFLLFRTRPLRGWLKHGALRRAFGRLPEGHKVHVGCGMKRLEGWVNVDLLHWPEVDVALDVTASFPFSNLTHIYAEHFLEHLEPADAVSFLVACHRALGSGGRIRLSTPNLDWVWEHLDPRAMATNRDATAAAMHANRAFYGWGHRFLWNSALLEETLHAAGFSNLTRCRYGESELPEFRGLEQHETYDDDPDQPHVLVVEARKGEPQPHALERLRSMFNEEISRFLE